MGRRRKNNTELALPSRVYKRENGTFYWAPKGGRKHHLGRGQDAALKEYRRLQEFGVDASPESAAGTVHYCGNWHRQLLRQAAVNARAKGLAMTLTDEDMAMLGARAQGKCELSGLPFSWDRPHGAKRRPWAPSLDRIDITGPYAVGNVRLVCVAVNIAMGEWGEETLLKMAQFVTRNYHRRTKLPKKWGERRGLNP